MSYKTIVRALNGKPAIYVRHAPADYLYGAIWLGQKSWNGVAILARGKVPVLSCHGLPGENDGQSRYIEGVVDGVLVGCLYAPNGNPAPGAKFDYKLRWFQRLLKYTSGLISLDVPIVLASDFK